MPAWRKLYQKTTESLDVNELPDDFTRLLWVLLPLGLDREGRGLDNPSWIKAKLMPLRTDVSLEQIALAIDCFAERGMIQRYEVAGRRYFLIPTWRKYQGDTSREAASVFPPPPEPYPDQADGTEEGSRLTIPESASSGPIRVPSSPSRPTRDPLMSNSPPDSESESDSEPDSVSDSPASSKLQTPGPPPGERDTPDPLIHYQKSFDLARLLPAQESALRALAAQYGPGRLCEVISWAVGAGIPQDRALRAIRTALPGWRTRPRSPTPAEARPPMLEVLERLRKEYPNGRQP